MEKIDRKTFIKNAIGLSAIAIINPLSHTFSAIATDKTLFAKDLYSKLVLANDTTVTRLIDSLKAEIKVLKRSLGYDFAYLSAAYSEPTSLYYKSSDIPHYLNKIIDFLLNEQGADGTLDIGNLASPPDTAFILEPLCAATSILHQNKAKTLNGVKDKAKKFIVLAGNALSEGGIHTPNHRWVVCAALARINTLYPDKKYLNRIEDWLGEGIYIDEDGQYLERSIIYSEVIDRCLITMARHLNRPNLLEPVRKNLSMTYYLMEPNGDLATVASRRQDQFMVKNILEYYHSYRYLATRDNSPEYSAITKLIEGLEGFEKEILSNSLFYFMEEPLLKKELPQATPPPDTYEKFYPKTHLARIRRGTNTTTIYGGTDWPLIIASGRSTSPNFFSMRKGEAILKYMRLSVNFFSIGYFRSEGITREGNKYMLKKNYEVPYYQPLPKDKRREDADYRLSQSVDGRFWNKMDFENRPVSNVKNLSITITVEEKGGKNEVVFDIEGAEKVPVTIELCFNEGGKLSGVVPADDKSENSFLPEAQGEYQFGTDKITFGPGIMKHQNLKGIDGEMYTSHFGSLRTNGMHVYLTGITPFKHVLTFGQ